MTTMFAIIYRPHYDSLDSECETLERKATYRQAKLRAQLLKARSSRGAGYFDVVMCRVADASSVDTMALESSLR